MVKHFKKTAFTFYELLISSVIIILIMAGMYYLVQTVWIEANARIALQRDARILMEQIVRGVPAGNGIREAAEVSLPSGSAIRYTSGIDGKERSFYLTDGEIIYDPDTSVPNNESSIAQNVKAFTVTNGDLITINLAMQKMLKGRELNVFLYTSARLRNS